MYVSRLNSHGAVKNPSTVLQSIHAWSYRFIWGFLNSTLSRQFTLSVKRRLAGWMEGWWTGRLKLRWVNRSKEDRQMDKKKGWMERN